MARQRTQKNVSARIDRTYIDRRHPLRKLRRTTIFICVAAAILFLVLTDVTGRGDLIQNPGRLTFVHAKFQNNCGACHDGCDADGHPTSKFSLAVSDGACLRCHDGAVHHLNQATMVVNDFRRVPAGPRSADCASCHAEHRGQAALVSANDLQCLQCHANLAGKTLNPPAPGVPMKVTDFTLEGHPHFGRAYMVDGKFVDPTDLKFGHEKHYSVDASGKPTILQGMQRNCTWCHNPSPSAGDNMKWETGKSAYALPGGEAGPPVPLADGTANHRSLNQVNYEKNCKGCHDLGTLPNSDVAIPHEDMGQIRAVILAYCRDRSADYLKYAKDSPGPKEKPLNDRILSRLTQNIPDSFSDQMDALTKAVRADPLSPYPPLSDTGAKLPADVIAKLDAAIAHLPTNIMPKADKQRVTDAIAATAQPLDHLRPLLVARLREAALKGLSGEAKTRVQLSFDAAMARYSLESPDPRLLEVYIAVANEGGDNCVKCHDLEGSVAAVPPEWAGMQMVDRPVSDAGIFATKPTGIPAGPRRWYV
ncbi:MAG TPA: hypothetical protein VL992_18590, partial [Tepidisphaeraceae bacterium]|nr:hypothetical protein [Tepidisphaeraceae bacterium]